MSQTLFVRQLRGANPGPGRPLSVTAGRLGPGNLPPACEPAMLHQEASGPGRFTGPGLLPKAVTRADLRLWQGAATMTPSPTFRRRRNHTNSVISAEGVITRTQSMIAKA